jgi:putative ABC transport system substrate-binding protein
MKRREFIGLLGSCAVGWPLSTRAQPLRMPIIGVLHSASPDPNSGYWSAMAAFRRGVADGGFLENQQVSIEYRWAEDHFERLSSLANELVQLNVSLIFAGGGDVAALAAKKATATIPIVFAIGADPVKQGIVSSLNRPGGNVTGATFLSVEIRPKMLELIRELVPKVSVIAVMGNPNRPNFQPLLDEVLAPARSIGLKVRVLQAGNGKEIEAAFNTFSQEPVDGLLVLSDPVYANQRDLMAHLEMQYKVPAVYSSRDNVVAGSLASYGASTGDSYYQAGIYSARILKGEKPSDLPVLEPTKFELVINLRTAKSIGLAVPGTLLARADEVIE